MVSATLIEKLEQLSPEEQKKIEQNIDALLKKSETKFDIKPGFGGAKGFFGKMSDDFDEPLDEFKEYM